MTKVTYTDITSGQPEKLVQPEFIEVEYRGTVRKHTPVLQSVFLQKKDVDEITIECPYTVHTYIVAVWTIGTLID